jgi:hypothetical protein
VLVLIYALVGVSLTMVVGWSVLLGSVGQNVGFLLFLSGIAVIGSCPLLWHRS